MQPRKQRKHLYNAPLHRRVAFMGVHLSKDLRAKFKRRAATVRSGDTVRVVRGQHKGKTGKVRGINRVRRTLTVEGVEVTKRDGSKALVSVRPSNLILIDVAVDKRRRLEKKTNG